ncbi:MAG: hypothetical protein SPI12_00060 [Actinomycetaceae bacterium]|nr:hypothetical protein [Actinomycetaceae bacterium]MDY6082249.1 hypothetical protein [Actinomycetaceae bacterium]
MKAKKKRNLIILGVIIGIFIVVGVWDYEAHGYGSVVTNYQQAYGQQTGEVNALDAAKTQAASVLSDCTTQVEDQSLCDDLQNAFDNASQVKALPQLKEKSSRRAYQDGRTALLANTAKISAARQRLVQAMAKVLDAQAAKAKGQLASEQDSLRTLVGQGESLLSDTQASLGGESVWKDASDEIRTAKEALSSTVSADDTLAIRQVLDTLTQVHKDLQAKVDALTKAHQNAGGTNRQSSPAQQQADQSAEQGAGTGNQSTRPNTRSNRSGTSTNGARGGSRSSSGSTRTGDSSTSTNSPSPDPTGGSPDSPSSDEGESGQPNSGEESSRTN